MKTRKELIGSKKEVELDVLPIVPGLAMGPAFNFRKFSFDIDDLNYKIESIDAEIKRFRRACEETTVLLQETQELSGAIYEEQFLEIFESQIALIGDDIFLKEIENMIREQKCSAAFAVYTVFREKMDYFFGLKNEYFRERALDIQDLKHKLLHAIFGVGTEYQISIPSIVFAEYLSPSDTVHFNRNLILGVVTDTGGKTSHAAIIARSLHLPYVINNNLLSKIIHTKDFVILDAYKGKIIINPEQSTINSYKKLKKRYDKIEVQLRSEAELPATTLDNINIEVLANIEFINELNDVKMFGAQGIGLFRTEGIFLQHNDLPDEEEQYQIYKQVSEAMKDKPIVLRTLDAGGDKILKGLEQPDEQNPFLGWRAIRFCIDEQQIFKTQLRAILRANVNKNIKILLPMVSCMREIEQTKKILNEVRTELKAMEDDHYPEIELGVMIEIPATAIMSDIIAREVDFLSFGTNDLTQYTLAVDRTNMKIAHLFNDMHPAIIRLMQQTIANAEKLDKDISICGEMAANPQAIPLLLGLGLRKFSLSPFMIPRIKKVIRSCTLQDCQQLIGNILKLSSAAEIVEETSKFYKAKISEETIFS